MPDFPNILAQTDPMPEVSFVNVALIVICAVGLLFFALWVLGVSGTRNLAHTPVRRNCLPFYIPMVQIGIWMLITLFATSIADKASSDSPNWLREFASFMAIALVEAGFIVLILFFAWSAFARRLKGFGLNFRTAPKDFFAAIINFATVLPLIFLAVLLVDYLGKAFSGGDFQMQSNESLTVIIDNPQLSLRILLVVFSILIGPIFEEVLFRGLVQSTIRSYINRPWIAVIFTSLIFATLHPWMHWPAIFILSMGMGYAYEKSGSLLRPIFIHIFFNAMSVTAALTAA